MTGQHIDAASARSGVAATTDDLIALLSPPRSFSSVACAMLGQHPQLYGLAETHLLAVETMGQWWDISGRASFPMTHGLLRSVAEVIWGEQTASSIVDARTWLADRSNLTSQEVMHVLASQVSPRVVIEKSPMIVYDVDAMARVAVDYPHARFIHLTRHPRGHGKSVLKHMRESARHDLRPGWLVNLGWSDGSGERRFADFDPQRSWFHLNDNIDGFLNTLPPERWLRVQGERLLSEPDEMLAHVADWLGVRNDAEAIESMKRPEQSPFARLGPAGARYGNDLFFLQNATLRSERALPQSLEGALEWRVDGRGFRPEVKDLAGRFGYE